MPTSGPRLALVEKTRECDFVEGVIQQIRARWAAHRPKQPLNAATEEVRLRLTAAGQNQASDALSRQSRLDNASLGRFDFHLNFVGFGLEFGDCRAKWFVDRDLAT